MFFQVLKWKRLLSSILVKKPEQLLHYDDTDKIVYNVSSMKTHSFQHGGVEIAKINSSGLYLGSNLLTSTVLGYLNTCTSNLQTQLNGKQETGS